MNNEDAQAWERRRRGGLFRFLLVVGVLRYGLGVGTTAFLVIWLVNVLTKVPFDPRAKAGAYATTFLFLGLVFSFGEWLVNEARFRRWYQQSRSSISESGDEP